MCGIVGIYNRDGHGVDASLLIRMTRLLSYRGPDEEGYFLNSEAQVALEDLKRYTEAELQERRHAGLIRVQGAPLRGWVQGGGHVGLGHRRLSIIDLSTGQQPLSNEDGTIWIVLNGEIYNFQELKTILEDKGHRFETNSDTETIIHAYEEWGEDCVNHLRGMFAYALWDENKQQLVLARDRVGKKPLYYAADESFFLFASEIKSILTDPRVGRDIDLTAFSDYVSLLYVPAPKTIFSSIRKLPAAHYAVVTRDALRIEQYWDLAFFPGNDHSEQQMQDELLGILEEATRLRMISDVPLGAFLSGGIDSSSIVALMAGLSQQSVLTNAISFSVDQYNEAEYAAQVAELFGTDHHEFQVTPDAMPVIQKLAWHYDEPFADSSAVPTYYVSRMARENVTVSLSGDGGDENFAGYRRYYFDMRENMVRNMVPGPFQQSVFGMIGNLYPKADFLPQIFRGKAFLSNVARDPVEAYFFSVGAINDSMKQGLLHRDINHALKGYRTSDLFRRIYDQAPARDHLSRIQYLDIKTYLCDDILTKVDRASMANSLEVRSPILDHKFMEYAATIPSRLKLKGKDGKHVLKKVMGRYLPRDILYRKKMGFGVPVAEWLRKDIREEAKTLILDSEPVKEYFNYDRVERMWNEHQSGLRNYTALLWMIMSFTMWHRTHLSKEFQG